MGTKISELNTHTPDGTEYLECIITPYTPGTNRRITSQQIADLGGGGVTDGDKGDVVVSISGTVWTVESASESQAGKIEIATQAETNTGTDDARAVTPLKLNEKLRITRTVTSASASVQGDDNSLIIFNSASDFNFTIDQLTTGSKFNWINIGTGIVTFVNGAGVTIDGYTTGEAAASPYFAGGTFVWISATDVKHQTSYTDSWQNWTPTYTGFSADPTGTGRYYQQGKFGAIRLQNSPGTSNATDFTLTMPFVAATRVNFPIIIQNNGVLNFGRAETTGGSNVLTLYVNAAGGAWTNSGSKGAFFSIFVEIQ